MKLGQFIDQRRAFGPSLIGAALLAMPTVALAQSGLSSSSPASPQDGAREVPHEAESYWSEERLRSARPKLPAPKAGPEGLPEGSRIITPELVLPRAARPAEKGEGSPPTVKTEGGLERRLLPPEESREGRKAENVMPEATSSFGARFTTSRVFPVAATTTYPYSAEGKLFFSDPKGGNFVCSASVLRPRIIVTAGHCVAHPSTNASERYFYTNFLFVPAYNNGAAPFGTWTSRQQWVSNAWYFSDGSVPNEQDVAMLIANDSNIGGQTRALGSVTGWFGYQTNQLANTNVTMLGYPCNLDNCSEMEFTNAQTFASGGSNTYAFGSAMRGGASGGGWVQDFGVNPSSNPAVPLGLNYIVAVTSYGPTATEPKYLGASNLDQRFLDLLTNACGANPGNC